MSSGKEDYSECFCTECAEPYSVFRTPTKWIQCTVINEPTTVAPDLAFFMFVGIASVVIIMRV
jgi:hypothetical protein